MDEELEKKLYNDFPLLFECEPSMKNSAMGFGFECGNGWYQLIRELCEEIYPLVKKAEPHEDRGCCRVIQVKEKYGTLRFYMNYQTDAMWDVIVEYEKRSATVCETCGKPGKIDASTGWVVTTCGEHKSK